MRSPSRWMVLLIAANLCCRSSSAPDAAPAGPERVAAHVDAPPPSSGAEAACAERARAHAEEMCRSKIGPDGSVLAATTSEACSSVWRDGTPLHPGWAAACRSNPQAHTAQLADEDECQDRSANFAQAMCEDGRLPDGQAKPPSMLTLDCQRLWREGFAGRDGEWRAGWASLCRKSVLKNWAMARDAGASGH